ncbi:MAG: hypothetical protein ACI4RF_02950 [Eubacterium sp.]
MKFETPIMNISMFEKENIVTLSGETDSTNLGLAITAVNAELAEGGKAAIKITF